MFRAGLPSSIAVGILLTSLVASPLSSAESSLIDLREDADVVIRGARSGDQAGVAVAPAGDVNGDGFDDVVIGARYSTTRNGKKAGRAYVVFGAPGPSRVDLSAPGDRGFHILGAASGDATGSSVAGIGDINGDGLDDVLIGAPDADINGKNSGAAYVVFGKGSKRSIDLANLGAKGYRISAATRWDLLGTSVAGIGDIDGDGLSDMAIGASGADPKGRDGAGETYVLFSREDAGGIDVATGFDGFRIYGAAGDGAGFSVADAGDVNGDGTPDVAIGAPFADHSGHGSHSGSAYVVFGRSSHEDVDLADLGPAGFRIDAAHGRACYYCSAPETGISIAGIGDMNRDGKDDIAVGAWFDWNRERLDSGSVYVIYGVDSSDAVDLAELGAQGYRLDGARRYFATGNAISGVGDVDGDAVPDLLIGAIGARYRKRTSSGSAYLIYGGRVDGDVDLRYWRDKGSRIVGRRGDHAGAEAQTGGDFNGDGVTDILIGAPIASFAGRKNAGRAYIVFGESPTS